MPFSRPSLTEIADRTFADLTSRLNLAGAVLRRSIVGVLSRVLSGVSHMLHGHIEWVSRQVIPDTAEDEHLQRWAAIWLNVPRKDAEFATGSVTFTGTINGTTIPAGTLLKRADGAEFETDADATLSAGTATAAVTAVLAGADGNTDAAVTLTLVNPIAGINSSATVAGGALTNGSDVEDDDSVRERLLARIQQPPHGGALFDYVTWAKEVPGVTRAWAYGAHMGLGTVGVTFVRDDDASIIPDGAEVTAVQNYIDERRPVTADVTVFAPTAVPLNFTIAVTPNTAAVKAAIEAELRDLLRRDAEPGGTIYRSRIIEAVSVAAGESHNTVTVPAADVTHTTGEIATFGAITWA